MKFLFVASPFPYPPDTGSRNLIYHWLEAASQKHAVDLHVIENVPSGKTEIPELPQIKTSVRTAPVPHSLPRRISRLLSSTVEGVPATSLVVMPAEMKREMLSLVHSGRYDAVVLTENVVAGYAPLFAPCVPVVLFKHSVQAVDARDARVRFGRSHPRWFLEEWIVERFERRTCRAASLVCCVNPEDAEDLARRYALAEKPFVVPIGVDLNRFPTRATAPGGKDIGFYGNLTWGANVDAALWFAEEILPKVWEKHPDARFRVVGPGSESLRFFGTDPRFICVGPVNQMGIATAMQDVAVGVVPVISGTGVRLKLLEMLSMGIPTVATSLGCLGTGGEHGKHLLVADDRDSFVSAVSQLLSEPELRKRLGRAGAELAPRYSWKSFYPRIVSMLEQAASRQTAAQRLRSTA